MGVLSSLIALGGVAGLSVPASAQANWPSAPIKIVVPLTAGGVVDTVARLIAPVVAKDIGANIVIENKPGANHAIGISAVARSRPDGHTWLAASIPMTTNPALTSVSYDAIEDFSPVAVLGRTAVVAVVPPALGVKNLQEFLDLAKAKPGELNFGNAANGSLAHLNIEMLSRATGVKLESVLYQGQAPIMTDLLTNRVQFTMASPSVIQPFLESGKLVPLATASRSRSSMLPDVPTFAELGYPDVNIESWIGILMPAKTPKEIVSRVNTSIIAALGDSRVRAQMDKLSVTPEPPPNSPQAFSSLLEAEMKLWPELFNAAGIKRQ
jgi:tripartite-type tricarboxylate transporter receptor subunit TctC